MNYLTVIVKSPNNYGAFVPDLPGCVATADTAEEAEREIKEAIEFHLQGMAEDDEPIPEAQSYAVQVEVSLPPRARAKKAG